MRPLKIRFDKRHDVVGVRHMGTIFALDVRDDINGYLSGIGPLLYDFFLEHDILLRPIGNTIYIMPPYCIDRADLELIYDVIEHGLDYLEVKGNLNAA